MERDMLRIVPIWVKFPNLPLSLWGETSLGKIGSVVGNPLFTDECTAVKLRVTYARILVEVDVTQKLCEEITIRDNHGNRRQQKVEYEWRPQFCEKCQKLGHVCTKEKRNVKRRWQPKQNGLDQGEGSGRNKGTDDQKMQEQLKQDRQGTVSPEKEQSWTTVERKNRDKGKTALTGTPSPTLCNFDSETMEVWNDRNGTIEGVP